MKLILTLLALTYATSGFSQTILRTAMLQLPGSPEQLTIEVSINEIQKDINHKISNKLREVENDSYTADPSYVCESILKITDGVSMNYRLLNSKREILGSKNIQPELGLYKKSVANKADICKSQFILNSLVSVIHPNQFVNFEFKSSGKKVKLAVSSNFSAMLMLGKRNSKLKVDSTSLKQIRWFYNNSEAGGARDLIDPANPPVEVDGYCLAHPYDCK